MLYILASTAGNDASEKNIVLFFSQCLVQFLGHCFLNFLIEIRVVKQFRKGVVVIKETLGHNIAELIREQRPHEHFGTVVLGIFSELLNLRVPHEHLIDPLDDDEVGIGEVTAEKVRIVQDADYIYREEIAKAGLDQEINQYFAALTNMRSVGVMGDERTYDYAVALRAVKTIDFMTAEAAEIPWEVLQTVMSRIINEVKGVNRVFYDLTSKPPGTIEFE